VNGISLSEDLYNNLRTLFVQRLETALEEQGIRYDLVEAALGARGPLSSVVESAWSRAFAFHTTSSPA
jgi:glycyl-tRNA synthetase beta subunit